LDFNKVILFASFGLNVKLMMQMSPGARQQGMTTVIKADDSHQAYAVSDVSTKGIYTDRGNYYLRLARMPYLV